MSECGFPPPRIFKSPAGCSRRARLDVFLSPLLTRSGAAGRPREPHRLESQRPCAFAHQAQALIPVSSHGQLDALARAQSRIHPYVAQKFLTIAQPQKGAARAGTAAGVPFEKRVGRLLEGLRLARSLWSGKPVGDGRWKVGHGILGPTPYRQGGPPIWIGGSLPASLDRAGRFFDGWLPIAPDADQWARLWSEVKEIARTAGRDPNALTGAMYLTVIIDEDPSRANERLNT